MRRVATLVARGALPADVFAAVAAEVAQLLDLPLVEMSRYEPDGTATVIGAVGEHAFETGTNWPLDGAEPRRTGLTHRAPARVDDYADVPGSIGDAARGTGVHAGSAPDRRRRGRLGRRFGGGRRAVAAPPTPRAAWSQFTELVATAISNSQAREELQRLADEQAALRRVAMLVARDAPARVIFASVCEEVASVLGVTTTNLVRYEDDGTATVVGAWAQEGAPMMPVASIPLPLDGGTVAPRVQRSGRTVRIDDYGGLDDVLARRLREVGIRSAVGAPIVVAGRLWGAVIAGRRAAPTASRPTRSSASRPSRS